MELTGNQTVLLGLFRAIEMERQEQAILLTLLNDSEQKLLIEWAIDLYAEQRRFPTEQEIMMEVSNILRITR